MAEYTEYDRQCQGSGNWMKKDAAYYFVQAPVWFQIYGGFLTSPAKQKPGSSLEKYKIERKRGTYSQGVFSWDTKLFLLHSFGGVCVKKEYFEKSTGNLFESFSKFVVNIGLSTTSFTSSNSYGKIRPEMDLFSKYFVALEIYVHAHFFFLLLEYAYQMCLSLKLVTFTGPS